ncbi:MAG TPA: hypothetical protein VFN78_02545 [Ktedonobacterales bacterium]|nr:hypothetical protein [Ktedonobacterales bacterium]
MANVMHGPFVKGAATSTGSYGTGVGQSNTFTSGNANNDETQAGVALYSLNPDLLTPFVLNGITCAKDGTIASQLDVASGFAYLKVSDNTLARCDVASTTFSTTGNPSTSLYLFLKNDGTWAFQLSSTGPANSLAICTVTTDGSSNIATVTDTRTLHTALVGAGEGGSGTGGNGGLDVTQLNLQTGLAGTFPNTVAQIGFLDAGGATNATFFNPPTISGKAAGWYWATYDGSATQVPFQIGQSPVLAKTRINDSGAITQLAGQASAGSFGVPVIVAQAVAISVTATGLGVILSFTTSASGVYRATFYGYMGNSVASSITAYVAYTSAVTSGGVTHNFDAEVNGTFEQLNATSVPAHTHLHPYPLTFYAASGTTIQVLYNNATATPADNISTFIERIS